MSTQAPPARAAIKALGRCVRLHVQLVEYERGKYPKGECKVCGKPLVEWSINTAPRRA